jgi:hypothetical protein
MKKVKKYETFDELKSGEPKTSNHRAALAKHTEFEKVMKEIAAAKSANTSRKNIK